MNAIADIDSDADAGYEIEARISSKKDNWITEFLEVDIMINPQAAFWLEGVRRPGGSEWPVYESSKIYGVRNTCCQHVAGWLATTD